MSGAAQLTRMSFAVTIVRNYPPLARYRCKPKPPVGVPSRVPTLLADVPLSCRCSGSLRFGNAVPTTPAYAHANLQQLRICATANGVASNCSPPARCRQSPMPRAGVPFLMTRTRDRAQYLASEPWQCAGSQGSQCCEHQINAPVRLNPRKCASR